MYVASPSSVYPRRENRFWHSLTLTSVTDARVMKAGEGDDTEVKLRYALHNDIVPNGGAMLDGTPHADLRNHVKNPDKNPDFFRIGALLAHDAESKNPDAVARAKEAAAIASSKRTADKAAIEAAERERQAEIASKAESVRLAREAAKKSGGGGSESGGSCDMGDFELRKRALTQDDPVCSPFCPPIALR